MALSPAQDAWRSLFDGYVERRCRPNWIETDKFLAAVPAGATGVVSSGGWQSTVVRRGAW